MQIISLVPHPSPHGIKHNFRLWLKQIYILFLCWIFSTRILSHTSVNVLDMHKDPISQCFLKFSYILIITSLKEEHACLCVLSQERDQDAAEPSQDPGSGPCNGTVRQICCSQAPSTQVLLSELIHNDCLLKSQNVATNNQYQHCQRLEICHFYFFQFQYHLHFSMNLLVLLTAWPRNELHSNEAHVPQRGRPMLITGIKFRSGRQKG